MSRNRRRILIVEDDAVIAGLEESRLIKLGCQVCGKAATCEDALALVQKQKPDLILLDIDLGAGGDGIDLAKILVAETNIPFIFLTAKTGDAVLKRVKQTIPAGFIRKPFSDDDLRIAIELALDD